jgi:hypothetical protein
MACGERLKRLRGGKTVSMRAPGAVSARVLASSERDHSWMQLVDLGASRPEPLGDPGVWSPAFQRLIALAISHLSNLSIWLGRTPDFLVSPAGRRAAVSLVRLLNFLAAVRENIKICSYSATCLNER